MEKRVVLSTWCIVMTVLGLIVLLVALFCSRNMIATIAVATAIVLLCGSALFYMPLYVSVDKNCLNVHKPLLTKSIPLREISSIESWPLNKTVWRWCGSGGWFGYWGWFSERTIGRFFAYYGKASECFLVTLKDGRKYMLSCRQPDELVDFVKKSLT